MQYYPHPVQYYQQSGTPGWGTSQFQFGPPAAPNFQPQPSWGGRDYYRAHAADADPNLFDHAWNSVRDYREYDSSGAIGVGIHEARHWHRRAYGGLGELTQMEPPEIGHAAAYEAYRTWIHNSSMHEPLSGDIERQREALIGLATAEASRLFQYTNRSLDSFARMEAVECAAATASHIFYWSRERDEGEHFRGRSHQGGFGDLDPYALDTDLMYPRPRHRSHSRHRSSSVHPPMGYAGSGDMPIGYPGSGGGMPIGYAGSGGGMPIGYAGSGGGMPIGYAGSGSGMPPPVGMAPGMAPGMGYAGSGHGMMPSAAPYPGNNYASSFPGSYSQQYGMQAPMQQNYGHGISPTYGSPTVMMQPGRTRSTSFSMPYGQQPQYLGVQQYAPGQQYTMPMSQPIISPPLSSGQTVIVRSHKKHRHRSSSRHHHRRSRSVEGVYDY